MKQKNISECLERIDEIANTLVSPKTKAIHKLTSETRIEINKLIEKLDDVENKYQTYLQLKEELDNIFDKLAELRAREGKK